VHLIEPRDRQTLGFEPKYWLWAHRARALMFHGDMSRARPLLGALLDDPNEAVDPLHRALACTVWIEWARIAADPAAARLWSQRIEQILQGPQPPYLVVLGGRYAGTAALAANDPERARELLSESLNYSLRTRAGLEMEAFIRAELAEATLPLDRARAAELAEEAVALAVRRRMRVAEALALAVRLRACTENEQGYAQWRSRLESLLEITNAQALAQRLKTGANISAPTAASGR
jgi:hypothetical protein